MIDFAKHLRSVRRRQGMTQRELGECLGIGQTAIANYEHGTRFPDAMGLYKMAEALRVSVDELLGSSSQEPEQSSPRPLRTYEDPHAIDFQYETDTYIELMLEEQSVNAISRITGLVELGMTVSSIYRNVLEAILYRSKLLFATGKIGIYQEQAITQGLRSCMELLEVHSTRSSARGKRFLGMAANASNIELVMISNFMYMEGWDRMCLGNYLGAEIVEISEAFRPDVIGMFITGSEDMAARAELIAELGAQKALVLVGGDAFAADPGLWQSVHADAHAPRVLEAAALLTRLF